MGTGLDIFPWLRFQSTVREACRDPSWRWDGAVADPGFQREWVVSQPHRRAGTVVSDGSGNLYGEVGRSGARG